MLDPGDRAAVESPGYGPPRRLALQATLRLGFLVVPPSLVAAVRGAKFLGGSYRGW